MNIIDGTETNIDGWSNQEDARLLGRTGPSGVSCSQCEARAALSPSGLEGFDWALNPYVGCSHGCAYCYAPSVLHIDRDRFRSHIEVRRNIPTLLSKELKRKERGVVGLGTVTDAYQPLERRFQVIRY